MAILAVVTNDIGEPGSRSASADDGINDDGEKCAEQRYHSGVFLRGEQHRRKMERKLKICQEPRYRKGDDGKEKVNEIYAHHFPEAADDDVPKEGKAFFGRLVLGNAFAGGGIVKKSVFGQSHVKQRLSVDNYTIK